MRHLGAILAVAVTALILLAIVAANLLMGSKAESPALTAETPATGGQPAIAPDAAAVQAAFEAREALLQAQVAELDAELVDRQAAYDRRIEELNSAIVAGEEQLDQFQEQEISLGEQIDQLLTAQAERAAAYESQQQQANYQYQVNIQQLQAQLDEGKMKLNEALARLGQ